MDVQASQSLGSSFYMTGHLPNYLPQPTITARLSCRLPVSKTANREIVPGMLSKLCAPSQNITRPFEWVVAKSPKVSNNI